MQRRDFLKLQLAGAAMLGLHCFPGISRAGFDASTISIHDAAKAIRDGKLTSVELVEACLAAIDKNNKRLNAIITLAKDAREQAAACDAETKAGTSRGPLHGIPLILKDNIDVKGLPSTGASGLFADAAPCKEDAEVAARLKKAGAIILAKANMDELAAYFSGAGSHYGPTYNPWYPEKKLSPGGSSSGTAAATAAGFCLGGLGTDTGGSVRVPAGWCGLCGIRPTYGTIDLRGVYPRAKTCDIVGPIGRTVQDVGLLLRLMANDELAKAMDAPSPVALKDLRIGCFTKLQEHFSPQVKAVYLRTIGRFKALGVACETVNLPPLEDEFNDVVAMFNVIRSYDFVRAVGPDVEGNPKAAKMDQGQLRDYNKWKDLPKADYDAALQKRDVLTKRIHDSFAGLKVHAYVLPTTPITAPASDAPGTAFSSVRICSTMFSLAQVPCVVFRGGLADGLPVGMQLVGPRFSERLLIDAASAFDKKFEPFQAPKGL